MEETLIKIETAILAKEKGFDWKTLQRYQDNATNPIGSAWYNHNSIEEQKLWNTGLYSSPTQSLLQKYLREVHNIELYVIPIFKEKCGYDSFKRDGFGFEIIRANTCQYLDWTDFEQCGEERDAILNDDDYKDDLDIQLKFKTFQTYEEALEIGLQQALKLI